MKTPCAFTSRLIHRSRRFRIMGSASMINRFPLRDAVRGHGPQILNPVEKSRPFQPVVKGRCPAQLPALFSL